jgi:hypothetical protein
MTAMRIDVPLFFLLAENQFLTGNFSGSANSDAAADDDFAPVGASLPLINRL